MIACKNYERFRPRVRIAVFSVMFACACCESVLNAAPQQSEKSSTSTESGGQVESATQTVAEVESSSADVSPSSNTLAAGSGLIEFNRDIRPILQSRCLECHGPKKAKNDFRVDQAESLMGYVEPGQLGESSLWTDYLTTEDEEMRMPPKAHSDPLSGVELAALKVWIEEGAKWQDALQAEVGAEESAAVGGDKTAPTAALPAQSTSVDSLPQRLWVFQGYFHPAAVHFPVALLIMAAVFGMASLVYREPFESVAFHCLWVGAVSSALSCVMGWSFAVIRGYGDWSLDLGAADSRHRWMGVALAAFAIVITVVALLSRMMASNRLRSVWLVGTLIAAAWVGIVGHQGGELTYGEEFYSAAIDNFLGTTETATQAAQFQHHESPGDDSAAEEEL